MGELAQSHLKPVQKHPHGYESWWNSDQGSQAWEHAKVLREEVTGGGATSANSVIARLASPELLWPGAGVNGPVSFASIFPSPAVVPVIPDTSLFLSPFVNALGSPFPFQTNLFMNPALSTPFLPSNQAPIVMSAPALDGGDYGSPLGVNVIRQPCSRYDLRPACAAYAGTSVIGRPRARVVSTKDRNWS